MIKNTNVICDVNNCIHNDNYNCSLNTLNISCSCNKENCHNKQQTICKNFTKK